MERVNQELEQYLRLFTNQRQDDWVGLLPFAEFQYNNQVHSSTQHPPFLLDTGCVPRMGFEPDQPRSHMESVNEFKEQMADTLEEAKAALAKSKDDMTLYYNRKRTPAPEFKAGDMVFLDASDVQTTRPLKQLSHWRLGLFPINSRVGNGVYRLRLPPSMSRLHPIFNVVKLSLAPPDPIFGCQTSLPPLLEIVDGEEEWVVEEILDSQMVNQKLCYLVKWEGFGVEPNSWEPWDNVHVPELVADFYRRHPGAARHIRMVDFRSFPFRSVLGHHCLERGVDVRGRSALSDISSDISLSPLYIPSHCC